MAKLFKLMVRCPATKQNVDTGIRTSGREALNSAIYQDGTLLCPHCGEFHSYGKEAFFQLDQAELAGGQWRPNL